MIREARRQSLIRKSRQIKKTETTLSRLREELVTELKEANEVEKSSLGELGKLIGISRQRVFQLVKNK
jgi:DNA-directed RNA polymerase specialized sigma subunit